MSEKPGELAETQVAGAGTWAEPSSSARGADGLSAGVVLSQRWELLALLGVGGMGSVYRARDRELDELVAVKVLRRELAAAPGMIERFRREVKLARRVTHPNVARTFDIGEAGELRFLTMELLDGVPLSALLVREGRLSLSRLSPIARAICAGLGAAHAAGVIHRDLKPDNVLCERTGRVAITDFGIARALESEGPGGDTHNAVVGTPLYMAPEQIAHDAPIGPAADVYALGCMLFELSTGEPPWRGPSPLATAAARLLAPPPDARARVPDVPPELAELLLRMMARDPAARPASADAVGEAIAAMAPSGGGSMTPPPWPSARPSSPSTQRSAPPAPSASSSTAWTTVKTLAVLPIENRSVGEDAYLAAALTDDLVDLLSATPGIRVRPRAVAERAARGADHRGGARDPRQVGRDLEVQVVVTGEVRRHAGKLQANVRLLTVEDGFQLWARRFTTDPAEFLSIGDEAAAAIAEALRARPAAPREAVDPEALDLYLRGRYLLQRSWGSAKDACDVLEQAYARAPDDPRIGVTYARALIRGFALAGAAEGSAEHAARLISTALEADPRAAEARLARASLHIARGEWVAGSTELRAVVESRPDLPEAVSLLGEVLVDSAAPSARAVLERSLVLDPGHFSTRVSLMRATAYGGDAVAARAWLGEPPPDPYDRNGYWLSRARLAMWTRNRDEAEVLRRSFREAHTTEFLAVVLLATTGAVLGLPPPTDEVQLAIIGSPSRTSPRMATFHLQYQTEIFATMGDRDTALASLAGADAHGCFDVLWADRCPALAPVRDAPSFAEIRDRIALRAERVRAALGDLATVGIR